ncbi:MAG: 50S ribosomal protein L11 methyltransferase [Solirubrobacterales bacterium]
MGHTRDGSLTSDSDPLSEEFVTHTIELPSGELRMLQPAEAAKIPDDHQVEWAPIAPYWSVLWRSGVALARELDREDLRGLRVVELGCGLAVPSIAAARGGAEVIATDGDIDALGLVRRNAEENDVEVETAAVDWADPDELVDRGPFDLVLASDVLYERPGVAMLLELLPRLAPVAWIADPGRPAAGAFLEQAESRWEVEARERGVVRLYRIKLIGT